MESQVAVLQSGQLFVSLLYGFLLNKGVILLPCSGHGLLAM